MKLIETHPEHMLSQRNTHYSGIMSFSTYSKCNHSGERAQLSGDCGPSSHRLSGLCNDRPQMAITFGKTRQGPGRSWGGRTRRRLDAEEDRSDPWSGRNTHWILTPFLGLICLHRSTQIVPVHQWYRSELIHKAGMSSKRKVNVSLPCGNLLRPKLLRIQKMLHWHRCIPLWESR